MSASIALRRQDVPPSSTSAGVGTVARAAALNARYAAPDGSLDVAGLLADPALGRAALVSSFGAESPALLHLVLSAAPDVEVVHIDTGKHFDETLRYRDRLVERLGIERLRVVRPDRVMLGARDADGMLHAHDPDDCCALRKSEPLHRLLADYDAWFTGRKRAQGGLRRDLPPIEAAGRHVKLNPLVAWSLDDVESYLRRHDLPRHPLVARGYPSIGCEPCTRIVRGGANARSGRWAGRAKTECGIHLGPNGRVSRATAAPSLG